MRPACMASGTEELLLRAALIPGERGREAWARLRATAELDSLDSAAHRLLPLLYRRLERDGTRDEWMPRLLGVWKKAWIRGELQRRQLLEALRALRGAGVEAMLLKGVDLALHYYEHPALRPMEDVDVMIRPAQARAALAALEAAGWKARVRRPERWLEVWHSVELVGAKGVAVDLHGHLLSGALTTRADEGLWERAGRGELLGEPVRLLEPGDLLLHVCAHGADWNPVSPVRWLADAEALLRRAGDRVDWERLASEAAARRRVPALQDALAELRRVLEAPVPEAAFEALRSRPVAWADRLAYRLASRAPVAGVGWLLRRALEWRQWRSEPGRRRGFLYFTVRDWDLASAAELPAEALHRAARRLRRGSAEKERTR